MEFVADLTRALAWPVVILCLVVVLRARIEELFENAAEVETKWVTLRFESAVRKARALAASALPDVEPDTAEGLKGLYRATAEISPRAAVIEGFATLEAAIGNLLKHWDVPHTDEPVTLMLRKLAHEGRLSVGLADAVEDLAALRNAAAHDARLDLSPELAVSTATFERQLADVFLTIAQHTTPSGFLDSESLDAPRGRTVPREHRTNEA